MPDAGNGDAPGAVTRALKTLTGGADAALLLAVSGGPDSMAMVDLVRRGWTGRLFAATVDHGLRAESADEAAMVASWCAAIGIPHKVLRPDSPITGSLQAAARKARYACLVKEADRCGAAYIVTAHHADDQLETILMRLARGSGVDGLAGIRARNGRIIRPLLGQRKADLERHCITHGLPFVHDPSNRDTDFDRVRMRSALAGFDLIDPAQARRSADALAQTVDALDWIVEREADSAISLGADTATLNRTNYPSALLRRLVLRCLDAVQPGRPPRGPALDRLLDRLRTGDQAMIGNVLCKGGECWRFAPAPPRGGAIQDAQQIDAATDNS